MNKLIFLSFMFVLTSCLQEGTNTAVDPIWGKESCSRCRMVLSEKRYAAQRILPSGEVHFYDDIGCAMRHNHAHNEGKLFVRPYGGEEWVAAEEVKYMSGLMTPMNSGIGAVKEGGKMSFSDIQKYFKD